MEAEETKSEAKRSRNGKAEANGKQAPERDPAKGAALKAAFTQIERQFGQCSL